jgi:hypothetical protein
MTKLLLIAALLAATVSLALAHDPSHQHFEWFKSLQNSKGVPCCDGTDGVRIEDTDWRMVDDKFEVRVKGEWRPVPPENVLKASNRVGYAVVWIFNGQVLCFLPGTMS